MPATPPTPRIAIFGTDDTSVHDVRGCCLWAPGCSSVLTAAGAAPTFVESPKSGESWGTVLESIEGVVLLGHENPTSRQASEAARLCDWCKKRSIPLLGIDRGLHVLNNTFGGNLFVDLVKEQPQALQHRHPPERGLRHAIMVEPETRLADLYGEGEIVVNSEHRQAVARIARGFRVSAKAMDGIVEAIEAESESWFAIGVQWQPASSSASGLDIQLFRGLIDACLQRQQVLECVAA